MKYRKHIFVCINERTDGRKSCGEVHGMALVNAFKERINKDRLNAEVRAQKAGCFDICENLHQLSQYITKEFFHYLLQLQHYTLHWGNLGLLVIFAFIMYINRNIDW